MTKPIIVLISFVFVSGCGVLLSDNMFLRFQIGMNDYDPNDAQLMRQVKPFYPEKIGNERTPNDTLILFETTGKEVINFANQVPLTWVHFWRPWCSDDHCQDISMYQLGSRAHRDKGLFLIMLSESYNLGQIDTITRLSGFLQPICVIDAKTYGTSLKENRKAILQELQSGVRSDSPSDDFIFRRDSLIFRGEIKNLYQLDSVLMFQ